MNSGSDAAVEQSRTLLSAWLFMEIIVFKKLIPVLGMLAFVAGPVFAADAPPASATAASPTHKSTHKASTHHVHHHKKSTKTS